MNLKLITSGLKAGMKTGVTFVKRNAPTIFTIAGTAGAAASVVLGCRATLKAEKVLEEVRAEKGEELTKMEVVKAAGPTYIPTLLLFLVSAGLILYAHKITLSHIAALSLVTNLKEDEIKVQEEKFKEFLGPKKKEEMRTEINKDFVNKVVASKLPIYQTGEGDTIFVDKTTHFMFTHDLEKIRRIVNDMNADMYEGSGPAWGQGELPYSIFLQELKLPIPEFTEYIGFTTERGRINPDVVVDSVKIDGLYYNLIDLNPELLPSYRSGWSR